MNYNVEVKITADGDRRTRGVFNKRVEHRFFVYVRLYEKYETIITRGKHVWAVNAEGCNEVAQQLVLSAQRDAGLGKTIKYRIEGDTIIILSTELP